MATTLEEFRDRIRELTHLHEAISLMEWDLRTGAPRRGHELRAEAIGTLAARLHEQSVAKEMGDWLNELSEPSVYEQLSDIDKALVRVEKKAYDLMKDIPANLMHEYQVLTSTSQSVWEEAKEQDNFATLQPYLEKIVDMKQQMIGYWGYERTPYNRLLDQFEPGMTVAELDGIFADLRRELVPLVEAIVAKGRQYDAGLFRAKYAQKSQYQMNVRLLQQMGYDFSMGRLDTTVHPFETTINRYDVRVTTHYDEADLREALFGTIHEGGHALYELGISAELIGTTLCQGTSMGIHESQSRFWENMIGRSFAYWEHNYPLLQQTFPEVFRKVDVRQFYYFINDVEPSLIRTEADEVTYNLHIMVRYELEKGLFDGSYKVADLPEMWREKMRDYLGIEPATDREGVLQDVHWSGGDFGYFPSYALGNLYAAQFRQTLLHDIPNLDDCVREGNLGVIRNWLQEQIHQVGRMQEPAEIVERVTGQPLTGKYLVDYLWEKYRSIYQQ